MSDTLASVAGSFALRAVAGATIVESSIVADLARDADPSLVFARQGETLDALIWRVRGSGSGAVERVLVANPGLADLGAHLPEGHPVYIPDLAEVRTLNLDLIQLWD